MSDVVALTALFFLVVVPSILILPSLRKIAETEVGLVTRRLSSKRLKGSLPIAFDGEAGYQAELLMPGLRFKLWILYRVERHPWVQVPAGEVGVVIAQIGATLPIGAKSAIYKESFGDYTDLAAFISEGGQKGVQRPVLPPGTLVPLHPVAFLVLTRSRVYGVPILEELRDRPTLSPSAFGIDPERLKVTRIEPQRRGMDGAEIVDVCGVVTTYEGEPLGAGDIASRLGGFEDIRAMVGRDAPALEMIEALVGTKNALHNNYQDFQRFLDEGGRIGLQHDPMLYGAYNLNPFLVEVEIVPMLVVHQGEVAVIQSYAGLPSEDTSGSSFKHGSIVKPGHQGIWDEPLRTGKYPLNPRLYRAEIVPTKILTLNWAEAVSAAHHLDRALSQIRAKSREGFVFAIDLQVQIHVPDTKAAKIISMVGTMDNLVNEVLQAAVGNHFRDTLQAMEAIAFIEERQQVQVAAMRHIQEQLRGYEIETRGVYIQDVIFPEEMVEVLTKREIAKQRISTFEMEKQAEEKRIEMEASKGRADQQAALARSEIGVQIHTNDAAARKAEADGEATFIEKTGAARAAEVRAVGLASAEAYERQVKALGRDGTATVAIAKALAEGHVKIVPEVYVAGGGGGLDGLAGVLMRRFTAGEEVVEAAHPPQDPAPGDPAA